MHHFLHRMRHALRAHHHHPHAGGHGHRGFHGMGSHQGFGGGPSGMGFDGLGRGRKLGSADLQLLLLALLADRPSYGYELIKALDERSAGYYSPSPGMVYPALTYLEEIGHATVAPQGARKLYAITEAGREHLDSRREAAEALLQQLAWIGERMTRIRDAMAEGEGAEEAGPDAGWGRYGGIPELAAARRALKSAMLEKRGASMAEQQRIAAILARAAAEIRGASAGE